MREQDHGGEPRAISLWYWQAQGHLPLFKQAADYAIMLMLWDRYLAQHHAHLHAFLFRPNGGEVLLSGPGRAPLTLLEDIKRGFADYRQQIDGQCLQWRVDQRWALEHPKWISNCLQGMRDQHLHCSEGALLSSWQQPSCRLISPLPKPDALMSGVN